MDDDALLAVVHRGRPATVEDAARLAHLDPSVVEAAVTRLQGRGLLALQDGKLGYPHPADRTAAQVSATVADLRRGVQELLGEIDRTVTGLPAMLRHFAVGEAAGDLVPVVTRHGRHASEDLWFDTARRDGGTLDALLPDVDRFLSSPDERAARFGRALMAKDAVRVIIPTATLRDPAVQESIRRFGAAGVDYRTLDAPPSWFWVDGDQLAVPFAWGEGRPTSVMGVRSGTLAGMARALYEELWRRAAPVGPQVHPWTPLLRLMLRGVTLETASRTLGVNPRTGRRRVAAAMDHYGVSTLFALGVACSADVRQPG